MRRTLYLQTVAPEPSKERKGNTKCPSNSEHASRSYHAVFQVLLSCHLIVWLQDTCEIRAELLQRVRDLQVRLIAVLCFAAGLNVQWLIHSVAACLLRSSLKADCTVGRQAVDMQKADVTGHCSTLLCHLS